MCWLINSKPLRQRVSCCARVVVILALCTMRQSRIYIDDMTFNQKIIDRNPNAWVAHYNLGLSYNYAGREEESFVELQTAVAENPKYPERAKCIRLRAINAGRLPEAIDSLQAALAIDPDHVAALNNMGIVLTKMGNYSEAIKHLRHALRNRPQPRSCPQQSRQSAGKFRSNRGSTQ